MLNLLNQINSRLSPQKKVQGARILASKITDQYDWIIANLSNYDPVKAKEINATCTVFEIVQMHCIKSYKDLNDYSK